MKLFIASHSRERAREVAELLIEAGHEVTARWICYDKKFHLGTSAYSDQERLHLAVMDEEDVRAADALILLAEAEGHFVPGGKHVETGMAIAQGKSVFVIGRRENLFHWHPQVFVLPDVEGLLRELGSQAEASQSPGRLT